MLTTGQSPAQVGLRETGKGLGDAEKDSGEVGGAESAGTTWVEGEGRQDDREDPVSCSEDGTGLDGHEAALWLQTRLQDTEIFRSASRSRCSQELCGNTKSQLSTPPSSQPAGSLLQPLPRAPQCDPDPGRLEEPRTIAHI